MNPGATLSPSALNIDAAEVTREITASIRDSVCHRMRRRGLVVGLSGGIDSSVVAALAARALGPGRVFGVMMPEMDSSPDSVHLGGLLALTLGIPSIVEDIGGMLTAAGCYRRRDDAIRAAVPEYSAGDRFKIVLPDIVTEPGYAVFSIVLQTCTGEERRMRLPLDAYLGIVAATNFKQRVRKMLEYHHADRLRYAVAGTANLLEYDQGFFVKNGDGSADVKPIAHLYKSQVYQLAEYLGVPDDIRARRPTTDTYPMEQSQEEFYFGLPLEQTDLCLFARNQGISAEGAADAIGLTPDQVRRAYQVIDARREAARYLHMPAVLVGAPDDDTSKEDECAA